jgi:hypothetical protein
MHRFFLRPILGLFVMVMLFAVGLQQAHADPRDFTLINSTGETISFVYVGPSSSDDWGDDILGADILSAGQRLNITFSRFRPGDCLYDIKVVTTSNREGYLWKVDLCSTTTVTFN